MASDEAVPETIGNVHEVARVDCGAPAVPPVDPLEDLSVQEGVDEKKVNRDNKEGSLVEAGPEGAVGEGSNAKVVLDEQTAVRGGDDQTQGPATTADNQMPEAINSQNGQLEGNGTAQAETGPPAAQPTEKVDGELPVENGHCAGPKSKQDKRKEKKKKQKQNKQQRRQQQQQDSKRPQAEGPTKVGDEDIVIEYVSAPIESILEEVLPTPSPQEDDDLEYPGMGLGLGASRFGLGAAPTNNNNKSAVEDFRRVLEKFTITEDDLKVEDEGEEQDEDEDRPQARVTQAHPPPTKEAEADSDDEGEAKPSGISKKQRKMMNRLKIAELKQTCERPDVVEVWDVTAGDPQSLVYLKAYRNTVPVPRHWSQKRKYLQGKRGIEKPPFKLPEFIEATGIGEMRQAYQEKEDQKKLKQKQRDRMRAKVGRMDIDYSVLRDAFFKYQTKPHLTIVGEMYYEGKEYEARVANVKPGVLTDELRRALGMSEGAPPPWLINMQRYGPPPSYPNLKVPGLNAPIPPGASFGYHPGGWGKPPVDEEGNPLYGDVFGQYDYGMESDEEVDKQSRWGELEEEEEEEEEEESEEEESEEGQEEMTEEEFREGLLTGITTGLASGITSSLPSGLETPEMINLRKAAETSGEQRLYTVLEQKQAPVAANQIMGSDHVYVLPDADKGKKRAGGPGDVEVTISPEELEGLDEAAVRQLYEERMQEMKAANRREDFSDMVAAKAAQQKRKLAQKNDTKAKKQKDFKF